ncbi:hypothetical protein Q9966_011661 [Columba livia]|nr:hypothetical protein Q9966_011661 [Columba livia]
MPSFKQLLKELRGRNAAMTLHASSLDRLVESQAKDLLALLQEHGPSTEGIFRLAAGEHASRELREALDSGAQVQLESQPVHLLAAILKEFLRKIPSKLLQNELYEDWMSALHKTSRQERLAGMKDVHTAITVSGSQGLDALAYPWALFENDLRFYGNKGHGDNLARLDP